MSESPIAAYGRLLGTMHAAMQQIAADLVSGFQHGQQAAARAAAIEAAARRARIQAFDVAAERARLDDLGRRIDAIRQRTEAGTE